MSQSARQIRILAAVGILVGAAAVLFGFFSMFHTLDSLQKTVGADNAPVSSAAGG